MRQTSQNAAYSTVPASDPELSTRPPESSVVDASVLSRWQTLVSNSFVPLSVEAGPRAPFRARMKSRTCEGVLFSRIQASAHSVSRTREHIDGSQADYLKLTLLVSGTAAITQDGRESLLHGGDIVLYDTTRPYHLDFSQEMAAVVVMFPHSAIGIDCRTLREVTALRLARGSFAMSVGLFLRGIPGALESFDRPTAARATHNAVDLIQTMIGYELAQPGFRDPAADLMMRIDDYIDAHLGTPALTPRMVAAANFISTRRLHELFHRRGTTVTRWIRQRQIERARRDLLDPRRMSEGIGEIARSLGFLDAAQFSKTFRAFTGTSPSSYRSVR